MCGCIDASTMARWNETQRELQRARAEQAAIVAELVELGWTAADAVTWYEAHYFRLAA